MPNTHLNLYRLVRFAVVALLSLWLGLQCTVEASRRNPNHFGSKKQRNPLPHKMDCKKDKHSVWYRNDCHDGFLAVISDRRVVTVNRGLDQHDDLGKHRAVVQFDGNLLVFYFFHNE